MKRIYTTLALLGALVTGAFAQTDLSVTAYSPVDGTQYPNFNTGDTMVMAAIIKNNGPDDLNPTDTIIVTYSLDWFVAQQGYQFSNQYAAGSLNCLHSGGSDTVAFAFIQGDTLGTDQNNQLVIAAIPSNTVVNNINFTVWGYDTSFTLLADDGINLDANNNVVCTDNNTLTLSNVKFGTTTGIKDLKNGASLNVFPNPASNQISFNYNFTAATAATLRVTDIAGRVVKTITLGKQNAGSKTFNVDIADLNNGMYYIELVTDSSRSISKFTKN